MGKAAQQPGRAGIVRTSLHIGVLALLVCGWGFLILRVPMLLQQVFPDFLLDRESGIATLALSNRNVQSPWSQEINFDVHSGELDWKTSREVDDLFLCRGADPKKNGYEILSLNLQLTDADCRLIAPHGSGIPDRDFQFPQYPYLINDRFAVTADADDLVVLDIVDVSSTKKEPKLAAPKSPADLSHLKALTAFFDFKTCRFSAIRPLIKFSISRSMKTRTRYPV